MRYILALIFMLSLAGKANLPSPGKSFKKIQKNYKEMRKDLKRNNFRHNYVRHIRHFSTFNKIYANRYNPYREDALLASIAIYRDLAFVSGKTSDFVIAWRRAKNFLNTSSKRYLRLQAKTIIKQIYNHAKKNNLTPIINAKEKSTFAKKLSNSLAEITKVSTKQQRLNIVADKTIPYILKTIKNTNNKKSFILEVRNAKLVHSLKKQLSKNTIFENLRVYPFTSKLVRFEFTIPKTWEPIIIEENNKKTLIVEATRDNVAKNAKNELLRKTTILLDPGHGGKDPGTVKNGLKEKNLVLAISKTLGKQLRRENYKVFFTRTNDKTLSLNERIRIARKIEPDLFISVHVNSSPNRKAHGIETYYFNVKSDKITGRIAMRENQNGGYLSNLDFILNDLSVSKNFLDAGKLASSIHKKLIQGYKQKYRKQRWFDRGTRGGPFYVLYNTGAPSILLEVGFLSNKEEARRLKKSSYHNFLSQQISKGLKQYIALKKKELPLKR